ncbi:MAG: hypothetical protein K2H70_04495, partial [Bacteroidales bacterium]|nr:hypothetical protein [Bacteroidales bacterium]
AVVLWLAVSFLAFHLPVLAQNAITDTTVSADTVTRLYGDSPCDTCPEMSGRLSSATIPDNQNLTGTVTKNAEYRSPEIVSSQVIASGSVVYTAGEITLGPGFEVKAGAQFEAHATDEFWQVNMLTYNLYIHANTSYKTHALYIKQFGADVVFPYKVTVKLR